MGVLWRAGSRLVALRGWHCGLARRGGTAGWHGGVARRGGTVRTSKPAWKQLRHWPILERSWSAQPLYTWGATVRGTYGTPVAGTRTRCVQYAGPWGQAALRLRYVPSAGGWYA